MFKLLRGLLRGSQNPAGVAPFQVHRGCILPPLREGSVRNYSRAQNTYNRGGSVPGIQKMVRQNRLHKISAGLTLHQRVVRPFTGFRPSAYRSLLIFSCGAAFLVIRWLPQATAPGCVPTLASPVCVS
ncbi:hypothetical protein KCP73_18605 [Salmonella enterica subsp. enterica]|nr:hypothetical protein KCP73_18605 [Salmonella enterica subsp. enterica]